MAAPKKQKDTAELAKSIVTPLVKDERAPHPFEKMEQEGTLPELTAIGICRVGETNTYVSYVIKSKGTEVQSIEVSEPNLRGIAEESSKIDFVTHFVDTSAG